MVYYKGKKVKACCWLEQFMTKYIASFAILSGAQLGSRIWPDWQKSSAALLLPLPSFPIDKRTEEKSLGQLP